MILPNLNLFSKNSFMKALVVDSIGKRHCRLCKPLVWLHRIFTLLNFSIPISDALSAGPLHSPWAMIVNLILPLSLLQRRRILPYFHYFLVFLSSSIRKPLSHDFLQVAPVARRLHRILRLHDCRRLHASTSSCSSKGQINY